ncbi:PilZ domain-containing protein [Paraconexibacter antarcticus]|uniref:PilZ domain-containing protein n=1 Tax=Paraconexibacter antarcticus TaxID=2949664 RepID=A0ABY5DWH3_9ACTN|nr:PilZ domain-containing protein [Paraconexibacter antarcticus]UTI65279.1 PilZ domain-containing protein [Paraconexibacter antarcticus]
MDPHTPERVRLTVPGLGAVEAWVARAVPGAAELVFNGLPPAPARVLHRRAAVLQSLPPDPPGRVEATLLAVPDRRGTLRADIVHALLAVPDLPPRAPGPAAPEPGPAGSAGSPAPGRAVRAADVHAAYAAAPAPERRGAERVHVLRAVAIHHPGTARPVHARTEDVSEQGLAVAGAYELSRGDLVRLKVMLDEHRPLEAIGEVRRGASAGRHGVQLVQMRPQDRLWLERWLAAERAAARAALLA